MRPSNCRAAIPATGNWYALGLRILGSLNAHGSDLVWARPRGKKSAIGTGGKRLCLRLTTDRFYLAAQNSTTTAPLRRKTSYRIRNSAPPEDSGRRSPVSSGPRDNPAWCREDRDSSWDPRKCARRFLRTLYRGCALRYLDASRS